MAFYNCTSVGCLSANTGTYSTLSNCQANCVSWGCPPGLSANTKIYFIYDSSGSYGSSLEVMYTAATAYTNSLQSNGWQGESYHILNDKQTWLYWPTAIYKHDLVKASPTCNAVNGISSQYMNDFHIFDVENNNIGSYSSNLLQSSNGTPAASCYCPGDPSNIVGGGVKKAEYDEDIIVVAIINEDAGTSNGYYAQGWRVGTGSVGTPSPAPDYGNSASGIGPKGSYVGWYTNHYITYSGVTNAGGSLKSVLMPRQSAAGNPYGGDWDESTGWTPFERKFLLFTTAAISSGNQDNINAGGTGVLDGTWISGTAPGSAFGPEAICALGETQISDPNIEGNYTGVAGDNNTPKIIGLEISNPFWDLKGNDGTQYTSSDWYPTFTGMPAQLGPDPLCTFLGHNCFDDLTDAGVPFTSSPSGIFGGLDQYGWSIDTSFSGATAGDIGDVLTNMVGWFPGVIPNNCTSAETSGNVDYPYGDQTNCELLCFGAQLPVFTYNCGPNGCQQIPGTGGTYQNLSACTASCTSYTCTVTGCTSTPGTGGTTTLSACTASCVHYECTTHWGCCEVVTSPTNINNPSLDYIYQTSGACEEGCIGWRCNNDLGLTPDTKIYVFYDTTSMAPEAIIEAYWGLQSFLANQSAWVESDNGGITGGTQQHMTVANERWLTWPLMAYGFNLPDGSSYFDWTIMTQNSGNNLGNNLPPTTNNYVTQAWNWIYGITPPPASHPNYPNPDHWAIAAGNPMGGTNEGGIGQQSLLSLINTNPNNPNYGMNATINPQFWVNTATTTDKHGLITGDTLVIIFADESEGAVGGQYHTTSYTAAYDNSAPTPAWKSDYGNYSKLWRINEGNSATTTCSASTKLNLRTFIYPTKGLNGVTWSTHRPFPINVLAAVSVGNKLDITGNTPFDGTWITGTAPCPVVGYNAATGGGVPGTNWNEYFSAPGVWNGVNSGTGNKPIAFMEMANGLESSNNYFTANNPDTFYYSAGTGSSINNIPLGYGGLEFLGFGTNISYPIIDGSLFAQDLTQFLQESTNNQSGTCVSAQTRVVDGGNYPYLAESACTASCVSYSCSANGCIEDPTYGTFESLSACTAICQSYTCTTTGCSVYNVPYFDINGWTDYSNAWGSGGTYFIGPNAGTVQGVIDAQLSCTTDCNTFYCTNDGCLALPGHQNPTGNAYSTLSACTSACTSFNCDPTPVTQLQGYPNFVGTIPGCDPIPNASGQYSAGLGRKDIMYPVTVASIQSIYKKANLFGHIDLCILDECHLLSPNQDGMYSSFFEDLKKTNPNLKVIGLTATPWREKGGLLTECTFFDDICYNLPIATLIKRNFLSPLVSKSSVVQADTAGIKITAGDFNKGELAKRMDNEALTREAVKELLRYGKSRKKWLIFCSSVEHAHHVSDELNANGIKSSGISGKTPDSERDAILARYQQGDLQAVTNYGVLTTGFDAPETDLVSLLRPTKSAGLYIQMLGRGMRIADGKKDCLVLDFGGNIERFGPVDKIAIKEKSVRKGDTISVQPTKICPNCRSDCHALNLSCPECGYEFNDRVNRLKIEAQASNRSVMSEPPREYNVRNVRYEKHSKIGKPDSVRAEYDCGIKTFKEWVCFDHQGYARKKARQWWFERCQGLIPESVDEALRRVSELSSPKKIKVDENSKYAEIVGYEY